MPATTLRFYETAGLLPAGRTPAGYRVYDEMAFERLSFIGAAKRLGLPLEEIAELLQVWEDGSCAQVRADLRPRLACRIAEAEQRAVETAEFIATLRGAANHLDALPEREGRCDPQCGFLDPEATGSKAPLSVAAHRAGQDAEDEAWRTAPVACSLNSEDMQKRAAQWRVLLRGATCERISDGVRLSMPAERAGRVAELAAAEQQCCPFFDFRLHLAGGMVRLEVRAPSDAAGLLDELFTDPASSPGKPHRTTDGDCSSCS
ncbi:MerR family transcriptional regulator [Actinomadura napierensis]|uniref:MerR family transcriptional regulator n=1 Tax=Actinomadura napierensis TaxID=267854 RepID=A0ABP5KPY6_9ACTN